MAPYSSEDRIKNQTKNMEQKKDVPVPVEATNNGTRENGWSDNPCKYHIFYLPTVCKLSISICNLDTSILQFRLCKEFHYISQAKYSFLI